MEAARTFDLDACTSLRHLVSSDIDVARVILVGDGQALRWKGDILDKRMLSGAGLDGQEYYWLLTTRDSLYDQLPEVMFLMGATSGALEIESRTREFFSMFDTNLIFIREFTKVIGQTLSTPRAGRETDRLFALFALAQEKEMRERVSLMVSMLPQLHRATNSVGVMENLLSAQLGRQVEISENLPTSMPIREEERSYLGEQNSALGESFSPGRSVTECESGFLLTVVLEDGGDVHQYRPGSDQYTMLTKTLANLIPFQYEYTINYRFRQPHVRVALGGDYEQAYLGTTTYA